MPHEKKRPKPPKRCLYCERSRDDGARISVEDILPKWLRRHVRKRFTRTTTYMSVIADVAGSIEARNITHGEDWYVRRYHGVCKDCNSNWMARLQQKAKPILLPMFSGAPGYLSVIEQETLAAWIAMTTMSSDARGSYQLTKHFDSDYPHTPTCTQWDRDWLRENHSAPKDWKIWIGRASADCSYRTFVESRHVIEAPEDTELMREWPALRKVAWPPNVLSTTFYIEQFYASVLVNTKLQNTKGWRFADSRLRRRLIQIWPKNNGPVFWPPAFTIQNREAQLIAQAFRLYVDFNKGYPPTFIP